MEYTLVTAAACAGGWFDPLTAPLAGDTVFRESLLFVPDPRTGQTLPCDLLFEPTGLLQLSAGDGSVLYRPGVDYRVEGRRIFRLPHSAMPCFTMDEFYLRQPASIEIASATCPGRYVRYEPQGLEVHRRQVTASYRHAGQWAGPVPENQLKHLPRTAERLRNGLELRLLFYGDSVMEGCDASGRSGVAPFMPPLDHLVAGMLARKYAHSQIWRVNTALGGTSSRWGLAEVERRVADLAPDLAVVRFGGNDSGQGVSVEELVDNTRAMVGICRRRKPEMEFLLMGPDLPNPDCLGWTGLQRDYGPALKQLAQTLPGCSFLPMEPLHSAIQAIKGYPSMTANCVNHPNDFMIRVYAGAIVQCL